MLNPQRLCVEHGCEKPRFARERCRLHYHHYRKRNNPPCSVEGCDLPYVSKGLCENHYWRLRRYGDALGEPPPPRTLSDRFWERVSTAEPDECWEWQGFRNPLGYGMFSVGNDLPGPRNWLAHRVALVLAGRLDPDSSLMVCHTCDNPPCVNERHLYAGTAWNNARDAKERGRFPHRRGSANNAAKVNEQQVREIRALHGIVMAAELAERYGISVGQVQVIQSRRAWRHVS